MTSSTKVSWMKHPGSQWRVLRRNEKAAQRVSFGAGYPADVHADIPADVRGQKLRSGPRNPGKTSISVRTSMTRRRGRPWPQGVKKTSVRKTSGWIFHQRSLAAMSLPKTQHWSWETLRSLDIDSNRAIGAHACNIRSTWSCRMVCESWPHSLNASWGVHMHTSRT